MKILVVDSFAVNRDPAQSDMYRAMEKHYEVSYCSTNEALWLLLPRSDVIFLGIYHVGLPIDWGLFVMTCDKPVIIDNADNEEQVLAAGKVGYQWMKRKVFTSRYLPHSNMLRLAGLCNTIVLSLPWYLNPIRFPGEQKKSNDIAFICSQYGNRIKIADNIRQIATRIGWSFIVGEYHGPLGIYLLSKSRLTIIECSRKCLTQKYIEASLCHTTILGDRPRYPANNIQIHETDLSGDLERSIRRALDTPLIADLSIFADEAVFINNLQKVIDAVLLVQG